MQVQGIDHAAINVRDLEAARLWYRDVLGLEVTKREPSKPGTEYFLDCGDSLVGLIQGDIDGETHALKEGGLGGNHFSFRVKAQEFDAAEETLRKKNVTITYIKKREFSWSMYFLDLDGNKLEITSWPQEDGYSKGQS